MDKAMANGHGGVRYSPKEESFSYFYKFDDVKSYASNMGVPREVSRIVIVPGQKIWPNELWPYEE